MLDDCGFLLLRRAELFELEGFAVFIPNDAGNAFAEVANWPKLPRDLLKQLQIVLVVSAANDNFIPIEAVLPLAGRDGLRLLRFHLLGLRFCVNVVDEPPLLQKLMYA